MSITKDDIFSTAKITDDYDTGKFVPVENVIKTSKVADELVLIWEKITVGECYANRSMLEEAQNELSNLIKTLRGEK